MPWTARYDERLESVEVVSDGVVTPEDLRQQTQQALTLARAQRCDRFLIDDERMKTAFSVFDLIAMVDSYRDMEMPIPGMTAVVLPASPESARTLRFYETVARNRIYNVRVFCDRSAAEAWLLEGRSPP